jgi:hypothetical protein
MSEVSLYPGDGVYCSGALIRHALVGGGCERATTES